MPYEPQAKVAEMMKLFGQDVRSLPRMIEDPKERLLAANLVIEEAVEFVRALGFDPTVNEDGEIELKEESAYTPDLVQAADAIGDVLVVTYGAANRLGVDAAAIFHEVHRSNLTKVWPDGTVHKRESDGKVVKPETYSPANIPAVLKQIETKAATRLAYNAYPEIESAVARGRNMWSWMATEAFGKAYQFTYTLAETSKEVGEVGQFGKILLARTAAKTIAFFHGYKLGPKKLAKLLNTTEAIADEFLSMFEARFPKLVPARPATEEDEAPAAPAAPVKPVPVKQSKRTVTIPKQPKKVPTVTQPETVSAEVPTIEQTEGTTTEEKPAEEISTETSGQESTQGSTQEQAA
jgi:predicted HAD superfamily Cof-like phosphohydrolase